MSYKRKIITAGKIKEVTDYHTSKCKSPKRPKLESKNTEELKELNDKKNERKTQKKLYLLMNANFITGDLYLTFTYKEEPTPEAAKEFFKEFLDNLRKLYKKSGFRLKYISITEGKRIHHHMLINNVGLSIEDIKKIWDLGFMKMQIFMGEPEDCERLTNYFIKESKNSFKTKDKACGLHWNSSKNLIHPERNPVIIEVYASSWREEPKPIKGYYISDITRGHTEQNYPYRFYRMIKIPDSEDGI